MRQLTIERAATIIIFLLLFALASRVPTDTDTWWHIRSGEHTLTQGMIYTDPFSSTMRGQPWINHSWGAQVLLYGVWQLGGNIGLSLYTAVLATAGMFIINRMCSGSVYLRGFALLLGAATAAYFWSPRPHMLSFFLSTVVLYLLYLLKYKQIDRLWLIPLIMCIWGNLHAGFSIGFIFLAGALAGEIISQVLNNSVPNNIGWTAIRKLILISLVSAATLLINPYGLNMLAVPFQTVGISALQNFIAEWNSPDFQNRQTWPFIALLLGTLGAVGASQKRLDWSSFVLLSGTAFMSLLAARNVATFAVVATPILAHHLNSALEARGWVMRPLRRVSPTMGIVNAILVAVVALGVLAYAVSPLDPITAQRTQSEYLPLGAVAYLRDNPPTEPMFNSYNWGGYLMFALPETPVFVDGRTDLYGDAFLNDYAQIAFANLGWQSKLESYNINTVVIESQSSLAQALNESPDWRVAYTDDLAIIFTRQGSND
jgi:hypothetical protein